MANRAAAAGTLGADGQRLADREQIEAYIRAHGGVAWEVRLRFYGPEKTIRATCGYAQERLTKAIPGATIQTGRGTQAAADG